MDRLLIAAAILGVCLIGLVKLRRQMSRVDEKSQFAVEFLEKFRTYINSRGENYECYGWMTYRSARMQTQLGRAGIFQSYRPPFSNVIHRNVPAIFTLLPELRNYLNDELLSRQDTAAQCASMLEDILLRHLGTLEDEGDAVVRYLRNPFIWLTEGMRTIVALPVSLLGWLGILSANTARGFANSALVRLVAGFAALIGFVSAIVGLIVGWTDFVSIVRGWLAMLD